jgi:DNA-directed RNA polymerase specialized sigma24 family protein
MNDAEKAAGGDTDRDLVQRTRTGDTRAFAELWRRHSKAAIHAARRFTSIDADDLVADAFTPSSTSH